MAGVGGSRAASERILRQLPYAQHPTMTRVMVVEDDVSIRDVLAELLTNEGYTTETAANGFEALARMRTTRPDVIVLDLMMPSNEWLATGTRHARRIQAREHSAAGGHRVPEWRQRLRATEHPAIG